MGPSGSHGRAWRVASPAHGRGLGVSTNELVKEIWREKVDFVLGMFDDSGLWERDDTNITVTDFGRAFTVVLSDAFLEDGVLSEMF